MTINDKKKMLRIGFVAFMVTMFSSQIAFADLSSVNYAVTADKFSGGTAPSIGSANYEIEGGSFSGFSMPAMASSNYKIDGDVGIGAAYSALPVIESISPANFSSYLDDETPSFTLSVSDPDGDALTYKAIEGAAVKDGPQSTQPLTWSLGTGAIGRQEVTFEVIDPDDGSVVQDQSYYVFRKPVK